MNLEIIPNKPGCYLFKNAKDIIIYIGKAKNIKKRVKSYFTKTITDSKTKVLISQIKDIDFIVCDSEIESLILENNLIKKHQPKYNISLKDSKRFAYLQITDEKFPKLILARKRTNKGNYFGPFVSGATREYVKKLLIKTFKLRTCKRLPKKECIRYHINLCSAPCTKRISAEEYISQIKHISTILNGDILGIIEELKKKMKESAVTKDFERSLELRNNIESLEYLKERQNMQRNKVYDEDILNFIVKEDKVYLILFNISKGILDNKQVFEFDFKENFLEEFLTQYYSDNIIPKEIIIPKTIDKTIIEFLEKKRGKKLDITIPKIGEKKKLLALVLKNIEIQFFFGQDSIIELEKKLRLNETPKIIECFDISHLSGTSTVASMVQFKNGQPNKSNYRRFKISTVDGVDDFLAMAEVIRRRYSRLINENQALPNLILIDGGKGQLSFALKELQKLNIKIPIISLAKKLEEIYLPGLSIPIKLDKKTKALKLLQRIRDEAHRFAISYNRLLRKKKLTKN